MQVGRMLLAVLQSKYLKQTLKSPDPEAVVGDER